MRLGIERIKDGTTLGACMYSTYIKKRFWTDRENGVNSNVAC